MANESAGEIKAEIRLELAKFQKDLIDAKNGFDSLGKTIEDLSKSAQKTTAEIVKNSSVILQESAKKIAAVLQNATKETAIVKEEEQKKINLLKQSISEQINEIKNKTNITKEEKEKEIAAFKLIEKEKIAIIKNYAKTEENLIKISAETKTKLIQNEANKQLDAVKKQADEYPGFFSKINNWITKLSGSAVGQFAKMAGGLQGILKAAPIIAAGAVIISAIKNVIKNVSEYINKTADAYIKQQKELQTLNTVIQATGASAWTSSKKLELQARELSKATGQSTNDIIEMQSRLITYNNIVGENFDRTQKAALNMASLMKMDLTTAAETLGKALDSPIEGLSSLTRYGFRFSDQVKENIKDMTEQGRISEAQVLILQQVERAYQGVSNTHGAVLGATQRLKNVQEELNAEMGRHTSKLANWVASVRLAIVESRLFGLRQNRIAGEFKDNQDTVKGLTSKIDELKNAMNNTTDSALIENYKKQLKRKLSLQYDPSLAGLIDLYLKH